MIPALIGITGHKGSGKNVSAYQDTASGGADVRISGQSENVEGA